ncbi:hypothetical protein M0R89_11630 [Halorussus limi]|uniref:Uncharacterized protein n=1 Tax=Halorussus limi TaxID=2938695 RepID=A0A8U0HQN6_9EURY|nr:hypothetical protein [Halorussus limi]UPV73198.1 hypothetical protein M0R89_11630 [Halorussus limi]
MTRPEIDGDELEMLEELEDAEDVGSHKRMVEILICEAYDEYDTDSFVYDPRESRKTPLSTDEMQDILWRYDAPAINPGHIASWPRDRTDKQDVLAAISRYEGIDSRGGVKSLIREHVGEGDPIVVETAADMEDKRRPRNYHHYLRPILDALEEHPPEEADNLPDGFHDDVEPMFGDDEMRTEDTAEEYLDRTRESIENDERPVGALKARVNGAEQIIEEHSDHPNVDLIEQARDDLEEEIERRRGSDEEDTGEDELDAGDEEVTEADENDELADGWEKLEKSGEIDEEVTRADDANEMTGQYDDEELREAVKREGFDDATHSK